MQSVPELTSSQAEYTENTSTVCSFLAALYGSMVIIMHDSIYKREYEREWAADSFPHCISVTVSEAMNIVVIESSLVTVPTSLTSRAQSPRSVRSFSASLCDVTQCNTTYSAIFTASYITINNMFLRNSEQSPKQQVFIGSTTCDSVLQYNCHA